jgi:hypothetical protein
MGVESHLVAFEAVQFFERSRSLQQRILGFAFRFPYLHLFSGLMLGEGNDLAHVCGSSVVGAGVSLADCTPQTHTHPSATVPLRGRPRQASCRRCVCEGCWIAFTSPCVRFNLRSVAVAV